MNDLVIAQRNVQLGLPGLWTPTGLDLPEGLSFDDWCVVGGKLAQMEKAVHWWIGDWLNYCDGKWGEVWQEAKELTGFKYSTLARDKSIASQIPFSTRVENLSWGHHQIVAPMVADEQDHWLKLAEENQWSRSELRHQIRISLMREAPPLPLGKFSVVYADPPWQYNNSGFNEAAESQYPTMAVEDICDLPIRELAAETTALFMWATNPLLPEALQVIEAWGFEYKSNMAWVKDRGRGKGWWLKSKHELLIIGTKEETPQPMTRPDSCFEADRGKVHSRKPEIAYEIIEAMYPGPYIELFARNTRSGWSSWGNEV